MALKNLLPGQLGFGTAPLGNMFRAIPEEEARATVDAAWNDGIRSRKTSIGIGTYSIFSPRTSEKRAATSWKVRTSGPVSS